MQKNKRNMHLVRYFLLVCMALLLSVAQAQNTPTIEIKGTVADAADGSPLPGATVLVDGQPRHGTVTDADGCFSLRLPKDRAATVKVSYVGYQPLRKRLACTADATLKLAMKLDAAVMGEVVVTAKAGSGPVTASVIGRDAMRHLQPNSIADLMELLPGGYAKDPDMGQANTISLRETGTMGAYGTVTRNNNFAISSLGTQFVVDGVPLNTDANLQYSPLSDTQASASSSSTENSRNITNRGVDMRTISTDDVESVEVVRGIPSAEYGNLTSGLVNIKKIRKAMPLTARFKADGYSKLFSIGKGIALNKAATSILNADLGYLDSKVDPTDNLESYKRITASLRFTRRSIARQHQWQWNAALDYSGSFDNAKEDPDINYGNLDEYKSSYSRMAMTNNLNIKWKKTWFREFDINTMVSLQLDRLTQQKLVSPQRYGIVPLAYTDGENIAQAVFSEYQAHYLCDGKPFNAYIKAKGVVPFKVLGTDNTLKLGLNWDMAKNYGRGQVYDMHRPLSLSGWGSRPRRYADIPALHNFSLFGEERLTAVMGAMRLEAMAGLRVNTMPHLSKRYDMSGRYYADPRINLLFQLPTAQMADRPLTVSVSGGYGITTKMPTMNYLYPDKYYSNFMSLAYYDTQNPAQNSLFVVHTYVQDPTNYKLQPARNHKWEVRLDAAWNDNTLSVDFFRESMHSGFRYSTVYDTYTYRAYDATLMTPGADYTTLPSTLRQVLSGYQQATNGSELVKKGVELQFNSRRLPYIRTRINITGAWFRTVYTNSQPMFESVSTVINNQPVREKYVGLYDWSDGRVNDQLNTNFTFDTQIPEWKLVFTTSVQCMWLIRTKTLWRNGTPTAYLSAEDGQLHEFTQQSLDDIYLQQLVKTYNQDQFKPFTVPMSMVVNFKATKEIGRYMRLAFFANKILDYLPDYTANGRVIRRNASPYFGVEASFTF